MLCVKTFLSRQGLYVHKKRKHVPKDEPVDNESEKVGPSTGVPARLRCPECEVVVTRDHLENHGAVCQRAMKQIEATEEAYASGAAGQDLPARWKCPNCEKVVTREDMRSHGALCGMAIDGADAKVAAHVTETQGPALPARVRCPHCERVLERHQVEGHDNVCEGEAT